MPCCCCWSHVINFIQQNAQQEINFILSGVKKKSFEHSERTTKLSFTLAHIPHRVEGIGNIGADWLADGGKYTKHENFQLPRERNRKKNFGLDYVSLTLARAKFRCVDLTGLEC